MSILAQVPLTASGNVLLVATAQGCGPAGWRVTFLGASWTGSVVLATDRAAPGQAQSLTNIAYLTASTGATNTAGTAITASGDYIIPASSCAYDLYAVYTHTAGSCAVKVLTEDAGSGGDGLTAAEVDGSASQNVFGAAVPYTGAYTFPGALAITGALTGVTSLTMAGALSGVTTGAFSGVITSTNATASSSTSTGAIVTAGGLGVAKDSYFGGLVSVASTISSTTPSTTRLTQSEVTLSGATIAVAGGGSIAGVRGAITVNAGSTFTEGFLYGTQGKVTLAGTMNEGAAARIAGVIGQVDLSTGTLTDGQVSAIWGDLQGNPTLTDPSQLNLIRATNSTTSGVANAVLFAYGKATYFATFGADGGAGNVAYWGTAAPTGLAKSLKIFGPDGVAYYIGCYSAAS
jgi:hypothetical protein